MFEMVNFKSAQVIKKYVMFAFLFVQTVVYAMVLPSSYFLSFHLYS